ncbi:MAG: YifB family Mg chelatase-like AAA ATPase [bacterium]
MSLSRVYSGLVDGIDGSIVEVETHIDQGLPGVHVVGLPDQAVKESRERIRPAIKESGFEFPNRKITVNLSPADKTKEGSTYDLPMTIGFLMADNQLEVTRTDLESTLLIGEIALDGALRPIPGVLPLSLAASEAGFDRVVLPKENYHEAEPTDLRVLSATHLREAVGIIEGRVEPSNPPSSRGRSSEKIPDFSDVRGQQSAKRGLALAASGGHNVLMMGPPGTGKSMLASRMPGILPSLDRDESLETTSVHSVAGEMVGERTLIEDPPFRAPHHTISGAGLIGGGRIPKPGEASLAHHGVLFLDELPEYKRSILETLRQPLEEGVIHVSRAQDSQTFPANFLLIGAMNPCPCGYLTHPKRDCVCSPRQIDRYRRKLSGPLLDRIDLHLSVGPVDFDELKGNGDSTSTADIRRRVKGARDRQADRYENEPFSLNAELGSRQVERYCSLTDAAEDLLRQAVDQYGYSARTVHRVQKVARTLADYNQDDQLTDKHMAQALQFREFELSNQP